MTGVGSLPGEDPCAALEVVRRWAPEVPFWPQLPARRDLVAEVLGPSPPARGDLLAGLARPAPQDAPGLAPFLAAVRAGAFPRARALKGQVVGPVTLAAALGIPPGDAAGWSLVGARVQALAATQAAALSAGGLPAWVWLDEPVLGTRQPLPPAAVEALKQALEAVRAAGAGAGVHVCSRPPWALLLELGPDLVSFDAWRDLEAAAVDPACAALLARGTWLAAGIVPTTDPGPVGLRAAELFRRLWLAWRRLGDPRALARRTLVTASCGLGLRPQGEVAPSFALARAVGRWVAALADEAVE